MSKDRALILMPSDRLFILTSVEDKVATKRFVSARHNVIKQSGQMSTFFDVRSESVSSLTDLSSVLSILEADPYSFIIRGELIEGRQKDNIRRTGKSSLFNDPNSNFNPAPRQWCMIDIDDLELPTQYEDIGKHKSQILTYTVGKLPEAFKNVDCHYQFSASMGVKKDKVRVHLWYWLDRKVSDAEMKAWMGLHQRV